MVEKTVINKQKPRSGGTKRKYLFIKKQTNMKSTTTIITLASLFLLASCTGKTKKANENALWDEKPQQTETVTAKAETDTEIVAEPQKETPQTEALETKAEQATVAAEKPREQKTENLEEADDNKIYERPDQEAYSPLSDKEFSEFVNKHLESPKSFADNPFNANSMAHLTIEKDGSISNIEIKPSMQPDLDKEYIRVLKLLPKFEPAKVNGKPVRSILGVMVVARAM